MATPLDDCSTGKDGNAVDGQKFDDLIKELGRKRLTRLNALRGLAAGAVAGVTGATLFSEGTDAKKKRGAAEAKKKKQVAAEAKKKRNVCHCDDATSTYRDLKLRGRNVKKKLGQHKRHTADYIGKCTPPRPAGSRCGPASGTTVVTNTVVTNNCTAANCPPPKVCIANVCRDCDSSGDCPDALICVDNDCVPCHEVCPNPNVECEECPNDRPFCVGDAEKSKCEAATTTTTGAVTTTTAAATTTTAAATTTTAAATTTTAAATTTTAAATTTTAAATTTTAGCVPACDPDETCIGTNCCPIVAECGGVCCTNEVGFCQGNECLPPEDCTEQGGVARILCFGTNGHGAKCCPDKGSPGESCVNAASGEASCKIA